MAILAGMDRGYYGGIERGEHSPRIETLYKLAGALGMAVPQFMSALDDCLKAQAADPTSGLLLVFMLFMLAVNYLFPFAGKLWSMRHCSTC